MPNHIVFLFPGMGETDATRFRTNVIKQLYEFAAMYQPDGFDIAWLKEEVEFVALDYCEFLSKKVAEWQKSSSTLRDIAKAEGIDDKGVLDWLSEGGSDAKEFFWSHLSHVVLYESCKPVRATVQLQVLSQMMGRIIAARSTAGNHRFSVVAYSLGTRVAHDCLRELSVRTEWHDPSSGEDVRNLFKPNGNWFDSIVMVANVCGLPPSTVKDSVVRPGKRDSNSYCDRYIDIRHRLDPLAWVGRLDAVMMREHVGAGGEWRYEVIEESQLKNWNVHDLNHYLDNPACHIPLLRELTSRKEIPSEVEKKAVEAYNQKYSIESILKKQLNLGNDALSGIVESLESLAKGGKPKNTADYLRLASEAIELVAKIRDELK